jgi:hypothetical protein
VLSLLRLHSPELLLHIDANSAFPPLPTAQDSDVLKAKVEAVTKASMKIGEAVYKNSGASSSLVTARVFQMLPEVFGVDDNRCSTNRAIRVMQARAPAALAAAAARRAASRARRRPRTRTSSTRSTRRSRPRNRREARALRCSVSFVSVPTPNFLFSVHLPIFWCACVLNLRRCHLCV